MSRRRFAGRVRPAVCSLAAVSLYCGSALAEPEDDAVFGAVEVDQFEYRLSGEDDVLAWEAEAWAGTDYDKIAFETEGELRFLDLRAERLETQLQYRRLLPDFFDLKIGVRHDFEPEPQRSYGAIGFEGLSYYWLEIDADLFVSETGDVSARLEVEQDFLITDRLILQPMAEINLAATSDEAIGSGAGVNDLELGLRLRYEIEREVAPYIGVHWERSFGETAEFARDEGEAVDSLSFLVGVRLAF